jgi:tripartite-type tricarboxylate transporter receptor subunit TctC
MQGLGEKSMTEIVRYAAALALLTLAATPASAQQYPAKPARIIVPFAAGGPVDVVARLIGQKLSEKFSQQFVIENQVGAGGNTGMGNGARAAADGYTILFVSSSYVVNPSLYAKVPYDPYKDFIPLTMVGDIANTLIVHKSVPAASVKELVTVMKANPGKYNNFAHAGVGTTPHLSGELFRLVTGVDMVHVPFAGAGPAIQSTVAGHTPIMFTTLAPAGRQVKAGNLRALAVMAKTRSPALPDVPTMEQAGFKDQEANTFVAALLPAGTPKPIVDLIYGEIVAALKQPDVRARLASVGIDAVGNTSEEFSAQIKAEIAKWGKVIKDAKIGVN